MLLGANESATVEAGKDSTIKVHRGASQSAARGFVRVMPGVTRSSPVSARPQAGKLPVPPAVPIYRVTDLGTLGGAESVPLAMNAAGCVVGDSVIADNRHRHAFVYANGRMKDLGTLGGGFSRAYGINTAGRSWAFPSPMPDHEHAFLYSGGTMTDLGNLGGAYGRCQSDQRRRRHRRLFDQCKRRSSRISSANEAGDEGYRRPGRRQGQQLGFRHQRERTCGGLFGRPRDGDIHVFLCSPQQQ